MSKLKIIVLASTLALTANLSAANGPDKANGGANANFHSVNKMLARIEALEAALAGATSESTVTGSSLELVSTNGMKLGTVLTVSQNSEYVSVYSTKNISLAYRNVNGRMYVAGLRQINKREVYYDGVSCSGNAFGSFGGNTAKAGETILVRGDGKQPVYTVPSDWDSTAVVSIVSYTKNGRCLSKIKDMDKIVLLNSLIPNDPAVTGIPMEYETEVSSFEIVRPL